MVDRQRLAELHGKTVMAAASFLAVPAILVFLAWVSGDPGADAANDADIVLAVLGGMAILDPLVTCWFARMMSRPKPGVASPADTIYLWSMIQYAVWEICALLGFVGFLVSGQWWFLMAGVVVTYAGFAVMFPRWDTWEAQADSWDAAAVGSVVAWILVLDEVQPLRPQLLQALQHPLDQLWVARLPVLDLGNDA